MSPRQIKTWLYFLTQGIALTCGVISVSVSPIVGKALAPSSELSTLPYGIQFATVIACSYVLAMLMQRFGRLKIFLVGSLTLFLAGIAGYISILQQSFSINLLAHILFGVSLSTFAFFRFAATEGLDDSLKSRALSLVTLGGILAAFVGPAIASNSRSFIVDQEFAASYLCFSALGIFMALLLGAVARLSRHERHTPPPTSEKDSESAAQSPVKQPVPLLPLLVAIYASGFGYMIMAMLMMQSSLKLNALQLPFSDIMQVIQWHVIAMFLPSLFMGRVIARTSESTVIFIGYLVMLASMLIAIYQPTYNGVLAALIGIGLGWNMLYVGGSSLVARLPGDAHRMQGINESAVAFLNASGAFSAGALFVWIGWENSNWLAISLLTPGMALLACLKLKLRQKHAVTIG
ncbi:MFS transporter [Aliamphritea hakodatensis]|uniref:MFS transporter n=1 Tax=Aliamphritea hakodatensis TaxID=2895352 RepID=UPI0022FD8F5B|nr:MFS transporter [Aliamphritea hakodatensis]